MARFMARYILGGCHSLFCSWSVMGTAAYPGSQPLFTQEVGKSDLELPSTDLRHYGKLHQETHFQHRNATLHNDIILCSVIYDQVSPVPVTSKKVSGSEFQRKL
jgi:hypothetical protein